MGSMAGSASLKASWLLIAALGMVTVVQQVACSTEEPEGLSAEQIERTLRPIGPLIVDELGAFRAALAVADEALLDWQLALEAGDGLAELLLAQTAYLDAMEIWQRLELLQIGPAASSLTAADGEDLRDEIYSWPDVVSGCRVDTETVEEVWDNADFFSGNLVNSYGLDALEHLLFAPTTTLCPSQVGIQTQWDTLGDAGIYGNRAGYGLALVADMDRIAADLESRWTDGLSDELPASGLIGLATVFEALFYLETRTKDRKLAEPLGIRDCITDCETLVESGLTGESVRWIAANLESALTLVEGDADTGFDALLADAGHEGVGVDLVDCLHRAVDTAEALTGPLDALIVDDAPRVQVLHDDIKVCTDIIRGDMATVLGLQIPSEAAGDND